jgi:hypothetical protein
VDAQVNGYVNDYKMAVKVKSLVLVCTGQDTAENTTEMRNSIARLLNTAFIQEQFLQATELVDRNYITTKRSRILSELRQPKHRSFRFFINKN